ncbi:MgtC/SapB family protein [Draconibacterium sp.]|jgi:putative Mg2+ transporter-C (MgtC) family protein
MESILSQLWILLDVIIAAVLCGFIGGEREKLDKPAGLRTNMIMGSISCFFVAVSPTLNNYMVANVTLDQMSMDAVRILQAIVVGVSFIGAGAILKSESTENVKNLTTASTLLYSAGIGMAVALHVYVLAIGLTILILTINALNTIRDFLGRIFKRQ